MIIFIIVVIVIFSLEVIGCIIVANRKVKSDPYITVQNNRFVSTNTDNHCKRKTYEVDKSIVEPNQELINTVISCLETVYKTNVATYEDLTGIIIEPADLLGRTHHSIVNRNMIRIQISFLGEILEFQSYPCYDSQLRKYFQQKEIDYEYNTVKYVALIGTILGDPDAFIIQLGKVIKNTYPTTSFSKGYNGKIYDGSTGMIAF